MSITDQDLEYLINKAGDFIGTDKELRSWACIDIALNLAVHIRDERNALRKHVLGLMREVKS